MSGNAGGAVDRAARERHDLCLAHAELWKMRTRTEIALAALERAAELQRGKGASGALLQSVGACAAGTV